MPIDKTSPKAPEPAASGAPAQDPRAAQVAAWLGQFSRTLKTCRLYDAKNPTSIKFREDLASQMAALLSAHGAIGIEFTANEVRFEGQPVLTARSREDNFAMPFYRDGLRTLLFQPDLETWEIDKIVDLVLRVTSRATSVSDDLVTLLWDADLPHVDMTYVSAETDADMGDGEGENRMELSADRAADPLPWPGGSPGEGAAQPSGTSAGPMNAQAQPEPPATDNTVVDQSLPLRSEDWLAADPVHELETCYAELEATRAEEAERFAQELAREREEDLLTRALGQVRSALASDLQPGDAEDLSAMLDRMLQESLTAGRWADACATVGCLVEAAGGHWDATELAHQLTQPESLVTAAVVRHLDEGGTMGLAEFMSFSRLLGPPATEWIMGIVATASHQRTRRGLLRTLTDMAEGNPERLAPWLADERWYVVRNAIIVIGSTEGGAPAGLFRPLLTHPEPRVRHEIVPALANCRPQDARPLLLDLIHDSEPSIRNAALKLLGMRRHPEASAALLRLVVDPGFRRRPVDEVRAILGALGGCAGDEALPYLEEQIVAPRWFGSGAAPHCQAVAFCIARIGTPAALEMLERGAQSKAPATRDACKLALKGMGRG